MARRESRRATWNYTGSRFSEVRAALFANAYYSTWGGPGRITPLPVYDGHARPRIREASFNKGRHWNFLQAARRTLVSRADLRPGGPDGRGVPADRPSQRRVPDWSLGDRRRTGDPGIHRLFRQPESKALIVGRYSTGFKRDAERALSIPRPGREALSRRPTPMIPGHTAPRIS